MPLNSDKEKAMNVKKLWIAVLLAMLLVASLAGEAGARERTAVSAWEYVTVPAAWFHPTEDGTDWSNAGHRIYVNSGTGSFIAPVMFPGSRPVIVKKVILYAYDNNAGANVPVTLYKTNPYAGTDVDIAYAQSALNSSVNPRVFSDVTITYAKIQRTQGAHLWLDINGSTDLAVYGVKIVYID